MRIVEIHARLGLEELKEQEQEGGRLIYGTCVHLPRRRVFGNGNIHLPATSVEIIRTPIIAISNGTFGSPGVRKNLVPGCRSISGRRICDLTEVDVHRTIVSAANGLVTASAVSRLVVRSKPSYKCVENHYDLTWCISMVTVEPAFTGHFPETPRVPPALHRMSALPTLVTGVLPGGILMH